MRGRDDEEDRPAPRFERDGATGAHVPAASEAER
jgi:hypothetical protein